MNDEKNLEDLFKIAMSDMTDEIKDMTVRALDTHSNFNSTDLTIPDSTFSSTGNLSNYSGTLQFLNGSNGIGNHSHTLGNNPYAINSVWYEQFESPTRTEIKKEILDSMILDLESELERCNLELEEIAKDDLGVYRINLEGFKRGIIMTLKHLKDKLA